MFLSSPRNAWAGFDSQGGFCESQGRFRAGFSQPALRVKIVWGRVGSLIVKSPHTIRNMFDGWFEIPTPFTVRTNPSNSHSQIETPMFPSIFLRGPSRFFFSDYRSAKYYSRAWSCKRTEGKSFSKRREPRVSES